MKTFFTLLVILITSFSVAAQAPTTMTYQAVVRNANGALIQSSPISMRVSILPDSPTGSAVYVENHNTQTNQNGLLSVQIGAGTVISGNYFNIFWGSAYYVKTEIDPLGGTNYTIVSTSQLLSVPYSNYSQVSSSLVGASSYYIGAYKDTGPFEGYFLITYLGADKVAIKLPGFGETIYATVFGNTLTIPNDNFSGTFGSGNKNGNNLHLDITLNGTDQKIFDLVKQ